MDTWAFVPWGKVGFSASLLQSVSICVNPWFIFLLRIIGEALGIAAREDDSLLVMIPELPRIVGLRNRLIHGYDSVDPELVWDVVQTKIPALRKQLDAACAQAGR